MPQVLPSPSAGSSSPWPQITQPYQGNMFGQSLQFVGQNRDRNQMAIDNEAMRELELKQALIGQAANMTSMGTDGRQMLSGYSGQTGNPYQPNLTAGMQMNNNAIESGQAANALQFGTAGAKAVEGGAVPRATPYAYEGNIPAAMGVRGSTRNISGTGGVPTKFERGFGMQGNNRFESGTGKVVGGSAEAVNAMMNQIPTIQRPEAEGAGGLRQAPSTPAATDATGDDALIQEYITAFEGVTDVEIVNYGGRRVIMARNPDGKLTITELNE